MTAIVLVVEDDQSIRSLIARMLRSEGHQVLEASDGATALEILQGMRCDLVITDFLMPKLNGIKFVEQLHSLQPKKPIILMTGHLSLMSDTTIIDKVAEVLAKPFDLNVLRSTVRRALAPTLDETS